MSFLSRIMGRNLIVKISQPACLPLRGPVIGPANYVAPLFGGYARHVVTPYHLVTTIVAGK